MDLFEHGKLGLTRILHPFYPRNPCSFLSVIQGRQSRSVGQIHKAPMGRQNILFDGATHPDCRCSMVRHTSRSNCEAVNENNGRGVSHRQANSPRRFSVGPSGLFYCVSFPAGVQLRSTPACNPSPFQGFGVFFIAGGAIKV